jgi:hypothetical protein
MASTRLYLINEQQTGSPPATNFYLDNCPVLEDIAISTTYQIAEVREPQSGTGSFTRTISIPGTNEVDLFFENIFDVNVSLSKYNPHLKVRAVYYVDELINFEGYLQILQIDVDDTGKKIYKCNILGEVLNLFKEIKGLYLTDLDYSSLNHTLGAAAIVPSWSNAALGVGIYYPIIDKGTSQNPPTFISDKDFVGNCCIAVRDYLLKIFTNAGYTWTSTFLDSTPFKHLRLTSNRLPQLTAAILGNNKFLANVTAPVTYTGGTVAPTADPLLYYSYNTTTLNTVVYGTEVYDAGGIHNSGTGVFTVPATNNYNITASFFLSVYLTQGATEITANGLEGSISIIITGTNGGWNQTIPLTSIQYGSANQNAFQVSLTNVPLILNDQFTVKVTYTNLLFQRIGGSATTTTLNLVVQTGAYSAEFTSNAPYTGGTVYGNDLIPENYLQEDFIKDVRKMFNLYITQDRNNANNLIIEPRPSFYLTTPRNWDGKLDTSKVVEVYPVGEQISKEYTFTYSDDDDYFNKDYLTKFKETYGTHKKDITNDFIIDKAEVKVSLAPTPLVGNDYNGLVISSWRKQENGLISPYKAKPRILYAKEGVVNTSNAQPTAWTYSSSTPFPTTYNVYPYLGHMDDPFTPTWDLNFGFVDYLYYQFPAQTLTTNNLYNKYYSQYINQITDKNSKLVVAYFYLTPNDIHIFDFRYPVFTTVNGEQGYYLVNKICDYNPVLSQTTKVELLKLVDYNVFIPATIAYVNGLGLSDDSSHSTNRPANQNEVTGSGNYTLGESTKILGGSGNFINDTSSNVEIINSTSVFADSIDNFMGVNLDSSSVIESDMVNLQDTVVIYSNGLAAVKPRVALVTSDFTIDGTYSIYEINLDTIRVDITCYWDVATYPIQIVFKIVSNTGGLNFIIDETSSPAISPPPTIDGNVLPFSTGLMTNESLTVYSNSLTLRII